MKGYHSYNHELSYLVKGYHSYNQERIMLRSAIVVFGERSIIYSWLYEWYPFTKYDNCWSKHNVFMIIWVGVRYSSWYYDDTLIINSSMHKATLLAFIDKARQCLYNILYPAIGL